MGTTYGTYAGEAAGVPPSPVPARSADGPLPWPADTTFLEFDGKNLKGTESTGTMAAQVRASGALDKELKNDHDKGYMRILVFLGGVRDGLPQPGRCLMSARPTGLRLLRSTGPSSRRSGRRVSKWSRRV